MLFDGVNVPSKPASQLTAGIVMISTTLSAEGFLSLDWQSVSFLCNDGLYSICFLFRSSLDNPTVDYRGLCWIQS